MPSYTQDVYVGGFPKLKMVSLPQLIPYTTQRWLPGERLTGSTVVRCHEPRNMVCGYMSAEVDDNEEKIEIEHAPEKADDFFTRMTKFETSSTIEIQEEPGGCRGSWMGGMGCV